MPRFFAMNHRLWTTAVVFPLMLPAPLVAQVQLDTLRIDSLMAVAADRMQTAALAVAREDADAVREAANGLFLYGGVFVDILRELAEADCPRAPSWVERTGQQFFVATERLVLAWDRSTDGEVDRWPAGPELILDDLEFIRDTWAEIKDENRQYCSRTRDDERVSAPGCGAFGLPNHTLPD